MIDVVMIKKAIKDGQLKVVWHVTEPNIISVYLADVIKVKTPFVEELGDMIKLCDIRATEMTEVE